MKLLKRIAGGQGCKTDQLSKYCATPSLPCSSNLGASPSAKSLFAIIDLAALWDAENILLWSIPLSMSDWWF